MSDPFNPAPTSLCYPKLPGPSIIYYEDLVSDDTPVLLIFKVFQSGTNLWYAEVYNRRTAILVYRTVIYSLKVAALADAKIWALPYLKGEATL